MTPTDSAYWARDYRIIYSDGTKAEAFRAAYHDNAWDPLRCMAVYTRDAGWIALERK